MTPEWIAIAITVIGAVIGGTMRFSSMETRLQNLENFEQLTTAKMDRILESLNRIEGRMIETDRHDRDRNGR